MAKIETTLDYVKSRLDEFISSADKKYAPNDVVIELRKENDLLRQEVNALKKALWTAIGGGAAVLFILEVALKLWL